MCRLLLSEQKILAKPDGALHSVFGESITATIRSGAFSSLFLANTFLPWVSVLCTSKEKGVTPAMMSLTCVVKSSQLASIAPNWTQAYCALVKFIPDVNLRLVRLIELRILWLLFILESSIISSRFREITRSQLFSSGREGCAEALSHFSKRRGTAVVLPASWRNSNSSRCRFPHHGPRSILIRQGCLFSHSISSCLLSIMLLQGLCQDVSPRVRMAICLELSKIKLILFGLSKGIL